MMSDGVLPGETPVSLNEARGWLRMGATIDDAVIAGLIRAATSVCEAFIGRRLIVRAAEDVAMLRAGVAILTVRPVVGVDAVTLLTADGGGAARGDGDYRLTLGRAAPGLLPPPAAGTAARHRALKGRGVSVRGRPG